MTQVAPKNNGNFRNSGQPFRNTARCPICGGKCRTIKTRPLTQDVTEVYYLCSNGACAHYWVAQVSPVRVIDPSRLLAPPRDPTPPAGAVHG